MEVYLSSIGNRTNEIVKVLTIISAIFLPPTLIAGVYGMNFVHIPELRWQFGYPFSIVLMVVFTVAMVFYFKTKGWWS